MKANRFLAVSSVLIAGALFSTGPRVQAGEADATKPSVDAASAFSRLKSLSGDVSSSRGKGHSRFEVIANDSVMLEHFAIPGAQEMLTAHNLDGGQLVLTHYCTAGNQPRMVAGTFDSATGELIGHSLAAPRSSPALDTCTMPSTTTPPPTISRPSGTSSRPEK